MYRYSLDALLKVFYACWLAVSLWLSSVPCSIDSSTSYPQSHRLVNPAKKYENHNRKNLKAAASGRYRLYNSLRKEEWHLPNLSIHGNQGSNSACRIADAAPCNSRSLTHCSDLCLSPELLQTHVLWTSAKLSSSSWLHPASF